MTSQITNSESEQTRSLIQVLHDTLHGTDADIAFGHLRHIIQEYEKLKASQQSEISDTVTVRATIDDQPHHAGEGVVFKLRYLEYENDELKCSTGPLDLADCIVAKPEPVMSYAGESLGSDTNGQQRNRNETGSSPVAVSHIGSSPAPTFGQPDEFTLLGILADIRQKTGVGDKPMLSELADTLAALIKRESGSSIRQSLKDQCVPDGIAEQIIKEVEGHS